MSLPRTVNPETLDHLAEDDPLALASRRDLQRINRVMGSRSILLKALQRTTSSEHPQHILELGAGDGSLMLGIARKLAMKWPKVRLTLLDRKNLVSKQTLRAFQELGWQVDVLPVDVLDWLAEPGKTEWDLVLSNLFIHHFAGEQLSSLLTGVAARTHIFIACEPRRAWLPLVGSHLIGLIGANAVTREDAVLSVHAGFRDQELSALWPQDWQVSEYAAGLFSHCFLAVRTR